MTLASSTELARFIAATATQLGLRVEAERASEVLERRVAAHRQPVAAYLDRIDRRDPRELETLANELTVGETYFLRHIEQFRAFADVAAPDRIRAGRLRVLSVGCSSGEEPYTLAMVLRDALPAAAFAVHAIDLSSNVIARARTGRYARWSLRAVPPDFERRWFQRDGRDVVVVPELRALVTFENANVLVGGPLTFEASWDVVFCRNMMMYLTESQADVLIARFARAIVPGGYLFLGHAESLRGRTDDFALCHTHGTFYYQRHGDTAVATGAATTSPSPSRLTRVEPVVATVLDDGWFDDIREASARVHAMVDVALDPRADRVARSIPAAPPAATPAAAAARPTPVPRPIRLPTPPPIADETIGQPGGSDASVRADLADVRELMAQERFSEVLEQLELLRAASPADRDVAMLRALGLTHAGRFADARAACTELLALDASSAGANYLLALCCESTGDPDGAAHLAKRAAELDPSFAMPRLHLGLLARRGGDRHIAARELTRAIALLEREAPARLALYGGGFSRQTLLGMCRAELAAIGGAR